MSDTGAKAIAETRNAAIAEKRDAVSAEIRDVALAVILLRRGAAGEAGRALRAQCGLDLPAVGRLTASGDVTLLWQGPDRYLAIRTGSLSGLAAALEPALHGSAHVVEASSSRAIFSVAGDGAEVMLARMLPIDLHPRVFPAGSVALTVAGHIDVLVWRETAGFRLACARSFAVSLFACLEESFA